MVKNLPAVGDTWAWSLGWGNPLEKGMATHSSFLVWRIPCTEEPGKLQSMGSQRVGHSWVTNTFLLEYHAVCSISGSLCLSSTLFVRCKIRESSWEADNLHKIIHSRIILHSLLSSWSTIVLGWPKPSLGFSREMLWKSQRELFGSPTVLEEFSIVGRNENTLWSS